MCLHSCVECGSHPACSSASLKFRLKIVSLVLAYVFSGSIMSAMIGAISGRIIISPLRPASVFIPPVRYSHHIQRGQYRINSTSRTTQLSSQAIVQERTGNNGIFYLSKKAMSEGAFAGAIPAQPPKATANGIILHDVGEKINIKIPNQIHSQNPESNTFQTVFKLVWRLVKPSVRSVQSGRRRRECLLLFITEQPLPLTSSEAQETN